MANKTLKGWRWIVLDSWLYTKGDQDMTPRLVKEMRHRHLGASVTTYKRTVRAGGAALPVTVVVVRRKEPYCTCGKVARGERAAYLTQDCAFCNPEVKVYA